MKHRTHDHLFAAAGVTAALSLIGTGATVLKGSVFHFDHWPLVAGDSSRATELPTAPIAAPEQQAAAAPGSAASLLAGATRVGGTAALLPGLGGPSGITAVGVSVPVGSLAPSASETTSTSGSTSSSSAVVAGRDGSGFSLGNSPSSSVDGSRDPVAGTGSTG